MTKAIDISALRKVYSDGVEALKGIDLTINQGGFFGLLGPNGAGKSTTINIVCSLVPATSGNVSVMGYDIATAPTQARQQLGVVPQEFNFNIFEPCLQVVVNQAGYYGVPRDVATARALELFDQLGLGDKVMTQAGRLSGGMKRRLMIARALVHQPKILILDEPTAGVDISLRRSMWDFLVEKNKDVTIILTTHYLEEAEALCKNLAIINKGTIIEQGSTDSILKKLHMETMIFYCESLPDSDIKLPKLATRRVDDQTLEVDLVPDYPVDKVISALGKKGIQVNRMKNKSNRLEEIFINLVEGE